MAVYTEVSREAAAALLAQLNLGTLQHFEGVHGGIENTNYFADTDRGRYVVTLFERLSESELPFYLQFMNHLAAQGLAAPRAYGDPARGFVLQLAGKPAAVVDRLPGQHRLQPDHTHCAAIGHWLARMHVAGRDVALTQPNPRGLDWCVATAPRVEPFLDPAQRELLETELAFAQHAAGTAAHAALPRGVVHADLFRDNALFGDGPNGDILTGVFDFYFAGTDALLLDIAVSLNDWCIDLPTGRLDEERARALVRSYQSERPLDSSERRMLPVLMRGAALRFWLSRLFDLHVPRTAQLLTAHDPIHFERVLRRCVDSPWHPD